MSLGLKSRSTHRYCKMVQPIWEKMVGEEDYRGSQTLPFMDWLCRKLEGGRLQGRNSGWQERFALCLWWIWRWRNDLILCKKKTDTGCKIQFLREDNLQVDAAFSNQNILNGGRERVMTKWIGWAPPQQGWNTLFIDGCPEQEEYISGTWGSLRDHNRN